MDASIVLREPKKCHKDMCYSLFIDSKRVNPILFITVYKLIGRTEATVLPTRYVVEINHTMWHIHDNLPCMDNDNLCREKPNNHRVFSEDNHVLVGNNIQSLLVN